MSWKIEKLGNLVTHRKKFITIDNSVEYKRCRVQVNRKGVVLRDLIKGFAINTKKQQVCRAGDFLVAEIDAKVGGYGFVPDKLDGAIVSSHYFLFEVNERKLLKNYLAWVIKTEIIQDQISSKGSTNYAAIRPHHVLGFEIPIPSIAEQAVFVHRLDNIQEEYNLLENELKQQEIYLKLLRETILQEAVQGKLTRQDPKDESATELLKRIKAGKEKLIKAGKLKKEKELLPIIMDETPFELAQGWEWCRLAEVCNLITDGTHLTPKYVDAGRIFLSAQNVKPFRFMPEKQKFVSEQDYQGYIKSRKAEKGDVLLTRVGAGIGEAAVIDIDLDFAFYVSLGLLKPNKDCIYPYFLELYLNSPLGRGYSSSNTLGKGVSAGNLNLSLIRNFQFPLPSLSEQQRILAKVQKLQEQLSLLEAQIQESQEYAKQLLQGILKDAFDYKAKVIQSPAQQLSVVAENKVFYERLKPLNIPQQKRAFAKQVLAGKIISIFKDDTNFTQIKFQKLQYLSEHIAQADLNWNYYYQSAGPYDNKFMHSIDSKLQRSDWFIKKGKKYAPLKKSNDIDNYYKNIFDTVLNKLEQLFTHFYKASEAQSEIVATLYAVWNNLLIQKQTVSEDKIIENFYNWSKRKEQYQHQQLAAALKWMRENNIVPVGFGKEIKKAKY